MVYSSPLGGTGIANIIFLFSPAGCPVVTDLAFLVDGSGSITEDGFTKMKTFVKRVLLHFSISDKG